MTALVSFDDATLGYGRRVVLRISPSRLPRAIFSGLVGPNGAGKTTILRAILGSLNPLAGTVDGAPGLRFGYVPQRDSGRLQLSAESRRCRADGPLRPHRARRRPARGSSSSRRKALEHVGISTLADQPLNALSGGQKQRTLIARALVGEPNVLVLDEPTYGMDLVSTTQILGSCASYTSATTSRCSWSATR